MNWLKRIFNMDIAEWVENTEKQYPWLENDIYFKVETEEDGVLFFTKHDVEIAKKRAEKNPEDV